MEKEIIKESVGEALQHAGEPTTITTEVIELDRDRVTSQTDVPPEVFEFNLNGVPCFPRCDVSVLTDKCNITANIHLNRTGDKLNLRGWLGTLMLQKSYEVFNCERLADNKTFAVEMLFSRLCQPCEDMYYRINEQGLPYTTKKPDTLQYNSKSSKDSRSSNTFNQEFVDQNPVNPELPWLFRKLFEAGFGSASFLGSEEMERRIMELSFIKQKQYYYRVVAEAEKQGVIKKVMTKNGRVGAILCPAD